MKKQLTIFLITILLIGCTKTEKLKVEYKHQKVESFSLSKVRLLDSPFKQAMEEDIQWLLNIKPNRLLHRFHKYAGLMPKDSVYRGWESSELSGHSLGHYLSAISMAYSAIDNKERKNEFEKRVNYIVSELARCQNARSTGYVGGIPGGEKMFDEISKGNIRAREAPTFGLNDIWAPWYTMHKLFAGLIDAYQYVGNRQAKKVVIKLSDWAYGILEDLSEEEIEAMLRCEYGGMNEALAEVYAITGNQKYLELSRKFHDDPVLEQLAQKNDSLRGFHANTQIPKVVGTARRYELTGNEEDLTISKFFWNRVVNHRSYSMGGHSSGEYFHKADSLHLGYHTCETCNSYNMLKLTKHIFQINPEVKYADFYERALYNHILASQDPSSGMVTYFVPLAEGAKRVYSTPFNSWWCCVGTGMENHVKYGENIYFKDQDGELYINLFIASVLNWKAKGLDIKLESEIPHNDRVKITVNKGTPAEATINIRYPSWAGSNATVLINGEDREIINEPGSYISITREWNSGDEVNVIYPMEPALEELPGSPDMAAIKYGPIILAGKVEDAGNVLISNNGYQGEIFRPDERVEIPELATENKDINGWLKKESDKPLIFKAKSEGESDSIEFKPFYQFHNDRYKMYFKVN